MKITSLALIGLIALTACSADDASRGTAASQESPAAAGDCAQGGLYAPIPGLSLDFPVHFRSDRIYTKDGGEVRRGVMLEYLEAGNPQTFDSLARSLASIGYAPKGASEARTDAGGDIKQEFVKQGSDELFVAVSPRAGGNPSNPDAKGTVWISWQLQPSGR